MRVNDLDPGQRDAQKTLGLRLGLWTLLVLLVGAFMLFKVREKTLAIALTRAKESFQKDLVYRLWATHRGGVYVPLDERTPPNPYLADVPGRDLRTDDGRTLTLVNPAYMTRMVHELGLEYGLKGHITSLNPLRPENAPDPWEQKALETFAKGARETWEVTRTDGQTAMRYMGAFLVEPGCLRCHAKQGYRVGDVRGGISVTVPMEGNLWLGGLTGDGWHFGLLALAWAGGAMGLVGVHRRDQRHRQERRRLEQELQHIQRLESLGQLAGGVAHDMNNVLAAILGLGSTLKVKAAADPVVSKAMDVIIQAAERGRELVKGLTDFARRGMGDAMPLDLNELVGREAQLLQRTGLQRLDVRLELEEGLPRILGDPHALGNALMNLCVNARDAMPEGGVLGLRTRLVEDGQVEVTVTDTGAGIPTELLDKVLEPFFTTKPEGKGTGLGLSVVYGTVKAHGGQLRLESAPGQGTTVRMTFPALPAGTDGNPKVVPAVVRTCVSPRRILLVDDDPLVRQAVPDMLGVLGHRVEVATSGQEGLDRLAEGLEVDLVILDLRMPGLSGIETLQQLRSRWPELAVLVATGHTDAAAAEALAVQDHVGVLLKPYSVAEVDQALARLR